MPLELRGVNRRVILTANHMVIFSVTQTSMKKIRAVFLIFALAIGCASAASRDALSVTDLRCEYAVDPLGVDVPNPRLFWVVESYARGQKQTAYEIIAASSPELLAQLKPDLWNTGKVSSDETSHIPYAGRPLASSEPVFWEVRAWDASGKVTPWSKPATWTMGILTATEWQAKWIGAADTNYPTIILRREFVVKPGLKRALANVCGLGEYELTCNGNKAADDEFPPGWTDYRKTCLYDTRDITALLRSGKNAVGLLLGNGMYNVIANGRFSKFKGTFGPLKAIAQLRLEYVDGSVEIIGTDEQWRVNPGPITFCSMYGGEDFDARLVQNGWDSANFDESKWPPAQVDDGPGGELKGLSCAAPPIHTFEVLKPVAKKALTNNITVYDLGQNAALMARFKVKGPVGSVVRVIPAELVDVQGYADRGSVGGKRGLAYWQYTLEGSGTEDYVSKFFYHGCRYLQVELMPASPGGELPELKGIEGVVVHSASRPVGEFECSNILFNQIRRLVRWAQRSNMMSLMTDCPHRERLGWLEEDHLNGPSLRYEFDLAQLFSKQMNDMADAQTADGLVPNIAPEYTVFKGGFRDSPEWGSACVLVPWQQYEFDGDLPLLAKRYDVMKNYVKYLGDHATNQIVNFGLGDWYDLGPRGPGVAQLTPIALTATAFYYYDTSVVAQMAALLGKTDDAAALTNQAAQIRAAFNAKFFDADKGDYATGSQTANSIPLVMGLVESEHRASVLDAVVKDVRAHGNALTAGDVGYQYLLRALADGGRSDVIFDINNQSEKPGYGYQLAKGATSLTESWDARRGSSQDHFMLGQIQEWFYHDLAGIRCDSAGPGFKRIILRPQIVGDVLWTKAGYNSIHGRIGCHWHRDQGKLTLEADIPANTTATIYVPTKSADTVTENGVPASRSSGVKFLNYADGCAIYQVDSGDYKFQTTE
jgi:alpha-L-rhamnosidase